MGNEEGGRNQADGQERDRKEAGGAARVEGEGLLRCSCIFRGDRLRRGEEKWYLHSARTLQDQTSCEPSHKGRCEEHLRQGDEGCRQTGEENRQGLPSGSFEGADLSDSKLASEREMSTSRG